MFNSFKPCLILWDVANSADPDQTPQTTTPKNKRCLKFPFQIEKNLGPSVRLSTSHQGGWGGGTLINSYIRKCGLFLGGSKFCISIFLCVFCFWKTEYFGGYEYFVDIFWGS